MTHHIISNLSFFTCLSGRMDFICDAFYVTTLVPSLVCYKGTLLLRFRVGLLALFLTDELGYFNDGHAPNILIVHRHQLISPTLSCCLAMTLLSLMAWTTH